METIKYYLVLLLLMFFVSCSKMTDFSPYDAKTSHSNLNKENISKILSNEQNADSLVFVAISDPHSNYSDLSSTVNYINGMEGISFVVICGDVTNLGLAQEYDDYYHIINRLNIPFITIIGNHDYLSNGKLVYNKMFGPTNFYFDIGNYRMVMFDNIVWENGNQSPDFDWLKASLNVPDGMTSVACYHIHIWDPQLENGLADSLQTIIGNNPVSLSIFGHGHGYKAEEHNGRQYLMIPDVSMRSVVKIKLQGDVATYKILTF
jgi:3',5'-cyclic-AMP phosphodiesterase